ncbi:eEF1A lysine and N-terminal methyltransferase-like [Asterias rubens]|uniref:eEF1A lysine and N-terminal methyltransferase-like n=1 Tax=Asterias rubens TaxID=7604 RepID=UPI001455B174|nr:eEF1A lysine and N-terminal methyltransferase-like [Asterias rubens]XP_033642865.1 eEF1A lysine and N-terminal methyltransferase-like [Asterias rubens]XP_033642866.1 eEF1A lysine and N-terminal methyltransferase-like [Asterias rubens]
MDLYTRSQHGSTGATEYWDRVIKKQGTSSNEWYGGYHDLTGVLHKYVRPSDKTLFVGDVNCCLSESLYDVGYRSLVNIDENDADVRQMSTRSGKTRPEMKFLQMDAGEMKLEDTSFNAVLDRGTVDFLLEEDNEEARLKGSRVLAEVCRILKMGGRFVCLTIAADHATRHLLKHFTESGWLVRLHKISIEGREKNDATKPTCKVPVFAFVFTKFKSMPGINMPLELCMTDSATPDRVNSIEIIMTVIEECKHYAMVRQILNTTSVTKDDISVRLYSKTNPDGPRYTIHVVDSDRNYSASKKFGIFITPQGRETEWMFCTDRGRETLAVSAGFQRLLVVSLHRDHSYTNMDAIKAELSSKVMELAPPGMQDNVQVPFLSIGDDIGHREVRYRGNSPLTGDFVVEDVTDGEDVYRRLVFLSGVVLVQSQSRLIKERPRKGRHKQKAKASSNQMVIDHAFLEFDFHKQMVAGLALVPQFLQLLANEMRILIIGLGAGNLPMFLYHHFPKLQIEVVELDGAVADVAKSWFGFIEDQRMKVFVEDGLKFIHNAEEKSSPMYHAIVFDVDAKDLTTGLNSPPKAFIEKDFLQKVASVIIPEGVFMINLVSRDDAIKQDVIDDVKTVFPVVLTKSGDDDVNETLYAISRCKDAGIATEAPSVTSLSKSSPSSKLSQGQSASTLQDVSSATELLKRLPRFGKDLQKAAQSAHKGVWDPDTDFSALMGKLQIR